MGNYTTVRQQSEFELEIKKSRFIGYASPAQNETEVKEFLSHIKSLHPQARHQVYAWRVGGFSEQQAMQRYSDDGEPAGTGGLPVLKKLDAQALTQLAVVVVRYFGGVLLGTGGLSRAYAACAEAAIDKARPVLMRELQVYSCVLPYHVYELTKNKLHETEMLLYDEEFEAEVRCKLACKPEQSACLMDIIQEIGNGRLQVDYLESRYIAELQDLPALPSTDGEK